MLGSPESLDCRKYYAEVRVPEMDMNRPEVRGLLALNARL